MYMSQKNKCACAGQGQNFKEACCEIETHAATYRSGDEKSKSHASIVQLHQRQIYAHFMGVSSLSFNSECYFYSIVLLGGLLLYRATHLWDGTWDCGERCLFDKTPPRRWCYTWGCKIVMAFYYEPTWRIQNVQRSLFYITINLFVPANTTREYQIVCIIFSRFDHWSGGAKRKILTNSWAI